MEFFYDLKMLNTGGIQKMATIGLMPFFFMLFFLIKKEFTFIKTNRFIAIFFNYFLFN